MNESLSIPPTAAGEALPAKREDVTDTDIKLAAQKIRSMFFRIRNYGEHWDFEGEFTATALSALYAVADNRQWSSADQSPPAGVSAEAVASRGDHYTIAHDGFAGTVIGDYVTLEGKRGVVMQLDNAKVVHVYGEKWLPPADRRASSPAPAAQGETVEAALRALVVAIEGEPRTSHHGPVDKGVLHAYARDVMAPALEEARATLRSKGRGTEWQPTHRHKKRGSTYRLLGVGKMQTENWHSSEAIVDALLGKNAEGEKPTSVDMREVAIYVGEDGQHWVRPIEEFNDGRFEEIPAPSSTKKEG